MTAPDPLDELLAREPYTPDDGFTDAVMARLPARRRSPRDLRPLVLGLSWAAAAALGAATLPDLVLDTLRAGAAALPPGLSPPLLLATLCAAGSLAYAASRLRADRA